MRDRRHKAGHTLLIILVDQTHYYHTLLMEYLVIPGNHVEQIFPSEANNRYELLHIRLQFLPRGMLTRPAAFIRQAKRTFHQLHARSGGDTEHLLRLLLSNPELTVRDAQNELHWIKQHLALSEPSSLPYSPHNSDSAHKHEDLRTLCHRRSLGEPLQYVLGTLLSFVNSLSRPPFPAHDFAFSPIATDERIGTTDFGPLTLLIRAPVLIPRPETAFIIERLASSILASRPKPGMQIVDLCTGSGCIAILLTHLLGSTVRRIRGYDISSDAIALAKENVNAQAMKSQVEVKHGNIFEEIGKVDLVVANPPYITVNEWDGLPRSVKGYEDRRALVGADNGMAFYLRIAKMLPDIVDRKGQVALEVGMGQAEQVAQIMNRHGGVRRIEIWKDHFGVDRMVVGWP